MVSSTRVSIVWVRVTCLDHAHGVATVRVAALVISTLPSASGAEELTLMFASSNFGPWHGGR